MDISKPIHSTFHPERPFHPRKELPLPTDRTFVPLDPEGMKRILIQSMSQYWGYSHFEISSIIGYIHLNILYIYPININIKIDRDIYIFANEYQWISILIHWVPISIYIYIWLQYVYVYSWIVKNHFIFRHPHMPSIIWVEFHPWPFHNWFLNVSDRYVWVNYHNSLTSLTWIVWP